MVVGGIDGCGLSEAVELLALGLSVNSTFRVGLGFAVGLYGAPFDVLPLDWLSCLGPVVVLPLFCPDGLVGGVLADFGVAATCAGDPFSGLLLAPRVGALP